MTDAHATDEPREGVGVKHIPDHAIGLALEEAALGAAGDDAARILTTMLKEGKTFADLRSGIDRRVV